MTTNLNKKALSASFHQYFASLVGFIFSSLTSIYIIRELTIEEYGIFGFIGSFIMIALFTTSFGLEATVQRYLPEYREKGNTYVQKKIVKLSLIFRFLTGFIFILIFLVANKWIINIFNIPMSFQNLIPLTSLIILLSLESNILGRGILIAIFENKYWNLSRIVYTIMKFILFYLSLSMGFGILGLIWSWFFVEIILFALFIGKIYSVFFSLPTRKNEIQSIPYRRFFNFGKYLILQQSTFLFRDQATDILLISYFIGIHDVGLYSFAFGIPLMLMSFSPGSRLRAVFTPLLVHRYTKTKDLNEIFYFFNIINKIIYFSMIPLLSVIIILSGKIIEYVFNPQYLIVENLFILSLAIIMIQQFSYAYSSIIYTLEKTSIIFKGSLFAFYNLVMDVILIPPFGILGAILATGSAGILLLVYYHFALKKEKIFGLHHPWKSFAIFSINTMITMIIVYFLRDFIQDIFSLISVMVLSGIIYLILSYVNKGFDEKDREIINEGIGKKIFVF